MSDLERAVDLAAWLIATGRQPPHRANLIAARKYRVDIHEVAQLVGRRGGRAAVRARRQDTASDRAIDAREPTLLPGDSVLTMDVIARRPRGAKTLLIGRLLDGPRRSEVLDFAFPAGSLPPLRAGQRVQFAATFPPGVDGRPRVILHAFLGPQQQQQQQQTTEPQP